MGYPMGERKRGSGAPGLWHYRSDPMAWRRTYRGSADQVTAARVFAKTLFAGTGREDDVASIVAELGTNAIRHSQSGKVGGCFGLEITLEDIAYIAITDQGGGVSCPAIGAEQNGQDLAEGGMGLLMVANMARWVGIHGGTVGGFAGGADLEMPPEGDDHYLLQPLGP